MRRQPPPFWRPGSLTVEEYRLASYYGAGGLSPEDLRLAASAELVADGTLSYSEALDGLVQEWLQQPTSDPVDLERQEERLGQRLADAAQRMQEGLPPEVSIAVLRPDVHPLALQALGLEVDQTLDKAVVNGLLSGNTAAGERIEGKRYAVEHTQTNPKTGEVRDSAPIGSYDFRSEERRVGKEC